MKREVELLLLFLGRLLLRGLLCLFLRCHVYHLLLF